ncbi:hypothetical protein [Hoeflea sp.]|uniref:hypothetical protein n=1 Tax=Hoeflea sp. TaxID=1940281 RepID=UPI003747CBD5
MNRLKGLLLASTFTAPSAVSANAEINVVAAIKLVPSLGAAEMKGMGEPGLNIAAAS